jgi:hypothetical protein
MRTFEEAEGWAREHSAVLKVNFGDGVAFLQVGAFGTYSSGGVPLAQVLPELVAALEQQMNERLTQPEPVSADVARAARGSDS